MSEQIPAELIVQLRALGACALCDQGVPLKERGFIHASPEGEFTRLMACTNPPMVTAEEILAVESDMNHMEQFCDSKERWAEGAASSPCRCAGRFTCSRCQFYQGLS